MRLVEVLITGGTPDALNSNVALRRWVTEGFAETLGEDAVVNVPAEVAVARVRALKPRLILVFGSCLLDQCEYSGLRRACDTIGAPLAFWLHDDPYEFDASAKIVRVADLIFTNDRWVAAHYHRDKVWHLPLAASPTAHAPLSMNAGPPRRDVFFCGVAYANRVRMLKDLRPILDRVHTEVFGEGWNTEEMHFCKNERIRHDMLPELYATSSLVLNLGRDFHYANKKYLLAPSQTPGPRTFEAAMAGACQFFFVDSLEVLDYFRADEEIVLFNDPAEFEERLTSLLADPDSSRRIGAAARARCLGEHTYAARAREILQRAGLSANHASEVGAANAPTVVHNGARF